MRTNLFVIARLTTANIFSIQHLFLLILLASLLPPFSLEGGLKLAPTLSLYLLGIELY